MMPFLGNGTSSDPGIWGAPAFTLFENSAKMNQTKDGFLKQIVDFFVGMVKGFVEWAVFGEPSGSSMLSQFPWSAVTMHAPPESCTVEITSPRQRSTVSTAITAAGITPVCPTMSGLAKLMIPNR